MSYAPRSSLRSLRYASQLVVTIGRELPFTSFSDNDLRHFSYFLGLLTSDHGWVRKTFVTDVIRPTMLLLSYKTFKYYLSKYFQAI